jgi:uncharacterized protein YecE (DUF72 family)
MTRVHVGCQGWNYDDWVRRPASVGRDAAFYPHGTRPAAMLEVYARAFETIEVDSTFYAIPSAQSVEGWRKRTPEGFTFSLKLPQEITHQRALASAGFALMEEFCERVRLLGGKLAVVLIQLPPQFEMTIENAQSLREFLPQLPHDIRFSVEFRSADWMKRSVADLLGKHNVALTLVEGQWLEQEDVFRFALLPTANFAYIRWMGERDLTRFDTVSRPQSENLRRWSEAITLMREHVSDVYAYFSNYYEGHAPASARQLKRLLGQQVVEPSDLEDQPSLF